MRLLPLSEEKLGHGRDHQTSKQIQELISQGTVSLKGKTNTKIPTLTLRFKQSVWNSNRYIF